MRKGQNPAKFVSTVAKPQRITAAVLNYIPFLSGFYAEALDVLKISLDSMRNDPGLPFDLMVFDNGSCPEVRDYLVAEKEAGRIQYLLLSEKNLGKGGAWNIMLSGAPGEIIAYADSDILYHPGWLARSVQVLETFPNVGMVTARPFFSKKEYLTATLAWSKTDPNAGMETGQWIPWEVFREFNLSLGQAEEEILTGYDTTRYERITYRGTVAIAGASHWQFTGYKEVLREFLPFDMDRPMGQVKMLDQRMNEQGYLRLMLPDPLVMNMSNTTPARKTAEHPKAKNAGLKDLPPVRKFLLGVYDWIFRLYYGD